MTQIKTIVLCLLFMMVSSFAFAESSYDISELYSVIRAPTGTKAVGSYDKTIEVKYILTPTKVDTGKYIVDVKKIGHKSKTHKSVSKPDIVMNGHHFPKK